MQALWLLTGIQALLIVGLVLPSALSAIVDNLGLLHAAFDKYDRHLTASLARSAIVLLSVQSTILAPITIGLASRKRHTVDYSSVRLLQAAFGIHLATMLLLLVLVYCELSLAALYTNTPIIDIVIQGHPDPDTGRRRAGKAAILAAVSTMVSGCATGAAYAECKEQEGRVRFNARFAQRYFARAGGEAHCIL